MKPYSVLPTAVEYKGSTYNLNLSYSAFYAALDALNDLRLTDLMRVNTALDILVVDPHPLDPGLLVAVFDLVKDTRPHTDGPRRLDIEQDWGYICAAFMQAYGIDLWTDKDMHILQFRALLESVPRSTKLADIVSIRGAEIPAPNGNNAKQIAELTRLKIMYAIKESDDSVQRGWARVFDFLNARAKNNA